MQKEITKIVQRFKKEKGQKPNVLFVSPEQLAELRESLGIAPEDSFDHFDNMEIIVIEKDNQ